MKDESLDSAARPAGGGPLEYSRVEPRRGLPPGVTRRVVRGAGAVAWWGGRAVLALLIVILLAVGFGTDGRDAGQMRQFADAVDRWQTNPDFRHVQVEYVEMGSEGMRTQFAFVDATRAVIWLRSLPGLPEHLRVNDTSLAHYTNFTR